jgi:hypothetical protein
VIKKFGTPILPLNITVLLPLNIFLIRRTASQRDESLVRNILELEEIRDYGEKSSISRLVKDVESLWRNEEKRRHDPMWETASWAPHRFASLYGQRIVVMIDEFQNLSRYIFIDEAKTNPDKMMPGSYHELAEMKSVLSLVI